MDNLTRTILDMLKTGLSIQYIDALLHTNTQKYGVKSVNHLIESETEAESLYNNWLDSTLIPLDLTPYIYQLTPDRKTLHKTTDLQKAVYKQQFNYICEAAYKGKKITRRTYDQVMKTINSEERLYDRKIAAIKLIYDNLK